jgi:outer membrane protein, multidrug efflux system
LQAPVLPGLVTAAQAASPTLASAAARVERARAARVAALAAGQPQAGLNGGISTGRASPGAPTTTTANLGVQAAWELDLFGAVAAGRHAAQARWEGAQAGWHQARVAVAAETASTYTALRSCEAQRDLAKADSTSRTETTRLTEASAKAGFTAPGDAALARASAAQGRSNVLSLAAQCEALVKALVELTDTPEAALRALLAPATGALPKPQPIATTALPANLLTQRPDVVDATRAVLAAAADVNQSSAREGPQISLSGSLGGLAFRAGGETQSGAVWSLGPLSITLPLLDGGARAAATAAARAGFDEAQALYRAQVRRAVR